MTVVALAVGSSAVAPWLLPLLAMLLVWAVLPTTLVILVIYARGAVRTFAIGALVPMAIWFMDRSTVSVSSSRSWLVAPILAGCCGFLAVRLRRFIRQRGWDQTGSDGSA